MSLSLDASKEPTLAHGLSDTSRSPHSGLLSHMTGKEATSNSREEDQRKKKHPTEDEEKGASVKEESAVLSNKKMRLTETNENEQDASSATAVAAAPPDVATSEAVVAHPAAASPKKTEAEELVAKPATKKLFPEQLRDMLSNPKYTEAIRWLPDGESLVVNTEKFAEIVPTKHEDSTSNTARLDSFRRKLNRWGFKRDTGPKLPKHLAPFIHPLFKRDQPELEDGMSGAVTKPSSWTMARYLASGGGVGMLGGRRTYDSGLPLDLRHLQPPPPALGPSYPSPLDHSPPPTSLPRWMAEPSFLPPTAEQMMLYPPRASAAAAAASLSPRELPFERRLYRQEVDPWVALAVEEERWREAELYRQQVRQQMELEHYLESRAARGVDSAPPLWRSRAMGGAAAVGPPPVHDLSDALIRKSYPELEGHPRKDPPDERMMEGPPPPPPPRSWKSYPELQEEEGDAHHYPLKYPHPRNYPSDERIMEVVAPPPYSSARSYQERNFPPHTMDPVGGSLYPVRPDPVSFWMGRQQALVEQEAAAAAALEQEKEAAAAQQEAAAAAESARRDFLYRREMDRIRQAEEAEQEYYRHTRMSQAEPNTPRSL